MGQLAGLFLVIMAGVSPFYIFIRTFFPIPSEIEGQKAWAEFLEPRSYQAGAKSSVGLPDGARTEHRGSATTADNTAKQKQTGKYPAFSHWLNLARKPRK